MFKTDIFLNICQSFFVTPKLRGNLIQLIFKGVGRLIAGKFKKEKQKNSQFTFRETTIIIIAHTVYTCT